MCAQSPSAQLVSVSHCSALFASTSAWEKLAVKAGHKLLTREKEALVLYHSTALMSFMCAIHPRSLTHCTHTAALCGQFIPARAVCVLCSKVAQELQQPSSAPQGCPHADGTALPSCHGTEHSQKWLTWDFPPIGICSLLLCTRNFHSRSDLPNS